MDHRGVHRLPVGERFRVEPQVLTEPERHGGQAVPAALVPWEVGLVDDEHRASSTGQGHRGGRTGGPAAHHYDLNLHQNNFKMSDSIPRRSS